MVEQIACLAGIAPWKRKRIKQLLRYFDVPFAKDAQQAVRLAQERKGAIACWATRIPTGLSAMAEQAGIPIWRIEDGFIRSVGLGAALNLPASIVLDRSGIYYDPAKPSDLETILQSRKFNAEEIYRAEALLDQLNTLKITKYNISGTLPKLPENRKIALVIGQVADDASMQLGAAGLSTEALVAAARNADPDAYLVYKPHPDVATGLRSGLMNADADQIVPDGDLLALIDKADSVHVLSSLAGFEALIRGKIVHVHGQPFYAGWGLTVDHNPPPRRGRKLGLAELIAGALIAYPLYCHPKTGKPVEVEELVDILWKLPSVPASPGLLRRWVGKAALMASAIRG
jgi:capsule polysaccharide export protein KpsC/LpsZ